MKNSLANGKSVKKMMLFNGRQETSSLDGLALTQQARTEHGSRGPNSAYESYPYHITSTQGAELNRKKAPAYYPFTQEARCLTVPQDVGAQSQGNESATSQALDRFSLLDEQSHTTVQLPRTNIKLKEKHCKLKSTTTHGMNFDKQSAGSVSSTHLRKLT